MSIQSICNIFGFCGSTHGDSTHGDSTHGVKQNRKARRKAKKKK